MPKKPASNPPTETCEHLESARLDTQPMANGCAECLQRGDSWLHLRLCLTCGHVGCCDSSENRHATQHFNHTQHPVIKSLERGEDWIWCYLDKISAVTHRAA